MAKPNIMPRAEWVAKADAITRGHCEQLKQMIVDGKISEDDYNRIGLSMQRLIAQWISMSDVAWQTFVRMIEESRAHQAIPHEPHPDDVKNAKPTGGPGGFIMIDGKCIPLRGGKG